jgi:WD40 repeat protein
MSDVFISYSRKDIAFARLLQTSLKQSQIDIWIDWERIPVGEKWWDEICQAIENANVFMFIVSKNSIGSSVCKDEINHALKNNKRIIPIVVDNLKPGVIKDFAPELPQFNWIIFEKNQLFQIQDNPEIQTDRPEDSQVALPKAPQFEKALELLSKAIHTNWEWVKFHTRLQVNALLWESNERKPGYLARGAALEEAEQRLLRVGVKLPQPTALQVEYVTASRKEETLREQEKLHLEQKARQRQRVVILAVGIGLVVAIVLGVVAWGQRNQYLDETYIRSTAQAVAEEQRIIAEEQRNIAVARQLGTDALGASAEQYDLGLLLSVEASNYASDEIWSWENLLEIFQTNPRLATKVRGHQKSVNSIAFNPDGTILASGSADQTIILWDVSTLGLLKQLGQPLSGHTDDVYSIAFNPDGTILASGSADQTIILWDVSTPGSPEQLGQPLSWHSEGVTSVAFSPDGKILASGSYDQYVVIWDISTPEAPESLISIHFPGFNDTVNCLAFSPDGDILAAGIESSIFFFDVTSPGSPKQLGKSLSMSMGYKIDKLYYGTLGYIESIAFSPDGSILASGNSEDTILLWDVSSPESPKQLGEPLTVHSDWVRSVAFSPDGKILASASQDNTIILWDVSDPEKPHQIGQPMLGQGHELDINSVAFHPNGQMLASGSSDGMIILWYPDAIDQPAQLEQSLFGHLSYVYDVAFSPDGKILASGSYDKTIILWDVSSPDRPVQLGKPLSGHLDAVYCVAFSPDGNILASGSGDGAIILWDISSPKLPKRLGQPFSEHSDSVNTVAFSPDGKVLASGSADKTTILWDISSPESPKRLGQPLSEHTDNVLVVAFNPKGNILASGSSDHSIILWDVSTPESPEIIGTPLLDYQSGITSLVFDPVGNILASGSYDGSIILWDIRVPEAPKLIGQPFGDLSENISISGLAFNNNGRILASGNNKHYPVSSSDGTIYLWDITTPESPKLLGKPSKANGDYVNDLVFSSDGSILAFGGKNETVTFWNFNIESWKSTACIIAGRNLTQEEWKQYMPLGEAHQKTCPDLP